MKYDLNVSSEPTDVKRMIVGLNMEFGKKGGEARWDSLAVWYGNKLPKFLWSECGWKNTLQKVGFTWQKFLRLMRYRTDDALLWVSDRLTWRIFVDKVIDSIQGPLGEAIRQG